MRPVPSSHWGRSFEFSATPLIHATRGNYLDTVEAILRLEPNVNAYDKVPTPSLSSHQARVEVKEMQDGMTALSIAAKECYAEVALVLLEAGAWVNVVDRSGDSILLGAVKAGNLAVTNLLLQHHADVDAKDEEGRTPLICAVDRGYVDVVDILLKQRPHMEIRTKVPFLPLPLPLPPSPLPLGSSQEGDTALLRSVRNRNLMMTQLLLAAGAKVSAADPLGDNPLHLSLRSRSKRLTQVSLLPCISISKPERSL